MLRKRKRGEEKREEEEERKFVKTNKNNYSYINDSATVSRKNKCNILQFTITHGKLGTSHRGKVKIQTYCGPI